MSGRTYKAKGFTLVELIVGMIILAILAALLIPAMTGFIDKAEEKRAVAETRQVVEAAQTYASEVYAMGSVKVRVKFNNSIHTIYLTKNTPTYNSATFYNATAIPSRQPRTCETMKVLSEVDGTIDKITINDKGQITLVRYTSKNNVTIEYTRDGGYVRV